MGLGKSRSFRVADTCHIEVLRTRQTLRYNSVLASSRRLAFPEHFCNSVVEQKFEIMSRHCVTYSAWYVLALRSRESFSLCMRVHVEARCLIQVRKARLLDTTIVCHNRVCVCVCECVCVRSAGCFREVWGGSFVLTM